MKYYKGHTDRCCIGYNRQSIRTQKLLGWSIGFTFLVLRFWYRLTRVVPDKVQDGRKTVVVVLVVVVVVVVIVVDRVKVTRMTNRVIELLSF